MKVFLLPFPILVLAAFSSCSRPPGTTHSPVSRQGASPLSDQVFQDVNGYRRTNGWTHTGVATVVDADGRVFATQLFGTIKHSQLTTRNRFSQF